MSEEDERVRIKTFPCEFCGRNFKRESLEKHGNICKKQTNKSRRVFDSGRQRATNSDVIYSKTKETMKIVTEGAPAGTPAKTHWREKHNEFIKSIRQARMISEAESKGAPLPKFEYSAVPSDYVNCPYCQRNFNQSAAQRHIPFCENQSKRQKSNTSANQRSNIRTQVSNAVPSGGGRYQTVQMSPQRKISAESANTNYSSASSTSRGAYSGSQIERRPIKYDSQSYYDNQINSDQGAYSSKNKQLLAQKNAQRNTGDQMLRTGRNLSNNELNNIARNRSGNSVKDTSVSRRQGVLQNGMRNGMRTTNQPQQYRDINGSSKYCLECGTEFPVAWAKFCSHCGYTRM